MVHHLIVSVNINMNRTYIGFWDSKNYNDFVISNDPRIQEFLGYLICSEAKYFVTLSDRKNISILLESDSLDDIYNRCSKKVLKDDSKLNYVVYDNVKKQVVSSPPNGTISFWTAENVDNFFQGWADQMR